MLIGKIPNNAKSVYPCDKTDCTSYAKWGVMEADEANVLVMPYKHNLCLECHRCRHFKGFDLYKNGG